MKTFSKLLEAAAYIVFWVAALTDQTDTKHLITAGVMLIVLTLNNMQDKLKAK